MSITTPRARPTDARSTLPSPSRPRAPRDAGAPGAGRPRPLASTPMHDAITDVAGIEVGHFTDEAALTGCTAVVCRQGAIAGVAVRGAAPGTRETDLCRPGTLVERAHAVVLCGGSAFGLEAASGVARELAAAGVGYDAGGVPGARVPAARVFDPPPRANPPPPP